MIIAKIYDENGKFKYELPVHETSLWAVDLTPTEGREWREHGIPDLSVARDGCWYEFVYEHDGKSIPPAHCVRNGNVYRLHPQPRYRFGPEWDTRDAEEKEWDDTINLKTIEEDLRKLQRQWRVVSDMAHEVLSSETWKDTSRHQVVAKWRRTCREKGIRHPLLIGIVLMLRQYVLSAEEAGPSRSLQASREISQLLGDIHAKLWGGYKTIGQLALAKERNDISRDKRDEADGIEDQNALMDDDALLDEARSAGLPELLEGDG